MCYVNRFPNVELHFYSCNKLTLVLVLLFCLFVCFLIISRFSLLIFSLVSLQPYLKMTDSFPFCSVLSQFCVRVMVDL